MKNTISLYDFAKHYCVIKNTDNVVVKFNEEQLNNIKEIEVMSNIGFDLRLINLRRGKKLVWIKN